MSKMLTSVLSSTLLLAAIPRLAVAQIDVGSTGADGFFNPTANVEIDLGAQGFYDAAKWMVIFNFTDVLIPAGVTVTFRNHPSRAPVVWLVQGSVTISGAVRLDGASGIDNPGDHSYAEPGPGGFRGGIGKDPGQGWSSSSGFGPGGGKQHQTSGDDEGPGASYATTGNFPGGASSGARYNNPAVFQLIGGSGGSAGVQRGFGAGYAAGGGGGGGAIFIAANNQISISSTGGILARGGNGGNFRSGEATGGAGSGGAIRLLANVVTASLGAQIKATGGTFNHQGGDGRIRIERNNTDLFSGGITPTPSLGLPREVFPPVGSPVCRILMIGSSTVTTDPRAGLGLGGETDLMLQTSDPTTIVIETEGVSTDWRVFLRVTGAIGPASEIEITSPTNPLVFTSGQNMQARVSALIDLPDGYTALQARAVHPTMAP